MLGSAKKYQSENAAMRMYNIKNHFKDSEWGILVVDWVKWPNVEKETYRMSQVLSEDEGTDEEFEAQAVERDVTYQTLRSHADAQVSQEKTEVVAAPAVALGSFQRMRCFPVKTPEEFEAEAQVPPASAAGVLERKVQLMASLLKSTRTAFSRIFATLAVEGRVTAPRDVDALVELADTQQLPMLVASVADWEAVEAYPDYATAVPTGADEAFGDLLRILIKKSDKIEAFVKQPKEAKFNPPKRKDKGLGRWVPAGESADS
ncbi:hypothetical protein CYMTET_16839 [Cymbomonas tetramitiformis]|uniref:Uncharacterized protein n=1 Tax=Cymbomonas tetramitiformis TaxID=36881 RepID=A0AAE0L7J7_9CHLO|nr:hypothetical protein CYMTET_16839 [Cymbomonas tetramitiformis]